MFLLTVFAWKSVFLWCESSHSNFPLVIVTIICIVYLFRSGLVTLALLWVSTWEKHFSEDMEAVVSEISVHSLWIHWFRALDEGQHHGSRKCGKRRPFTEWPTRKRMEKEDSYSLQSPLVTDFLLLGHTSKVSRAPQKSTTS